MKIQVPYLKTAHMYKNSSQRLTSRNCGVSFPHKRICLSKGNSTECVNMDHYTEKSYTKSYTEGEPQLFDNLYQRGMNNNCYNWFCCKTVGEIFFSHTNPQLVNFWTLSISIYFCQSKRCLLYAEYSWSYTNSRI